MPHAGFKEVSITIKIGKREIEVSRMADALARAWNTETPMQRFMMKKARRDAKESFLLARRTIKQMMGG